METALPALLAIAFNISHNHFKSVLLVINHYSLVCDVLQAIQAYALHVNWATI